jgi:hypothetical protein
VNLLIFGAGAFVGCFLGVFVTAACALAYRNTGWEDWRRD